MINQELAEIFQNMAEILEFLGNPTERYRIRAYQNVSLSIKDVSENIEILAKQKRLRDIPGVGEGIAKKIEEYVAHGKIKEYELLKKSIPKGFFELMKVPSLGPKKVKALYAELGIKSIPDLEKAIAAGKVAQLPGFGEKSSQKMLEGIAIKSSSKGRRLLGDVYLTVQQIIESLRKCKDVMAVASAGSFRRFEETVGDIDILATGKHQERIIAYFCKQPYISKILSRGPTKATILLHDGLQVDLRVLQPDLFGSALQYFTGSKLHNVHLRTFAKNRGFKLSEYGFFKGEKLVASKTEEECYAALGMQYIPPEMRLDTGEIEAAYRHELPKLIGLSDIRGDLHAHSTWSDGNHSVLQMAQEAHKRGYEYIAMTDHSPSLHIANGLSLDRLKKKKREIDELNAKLPIRILFGTEVDILARGEIDYPDEVLKMFDVVVASVHRRLNQDNTERILKAMEHPSVHIIGHPSGRRIGLRQPYSLEYEKVFKKAAETGTVLEINANYERLDLQDQYIREAKRHKCLFSIDSDAHSANALWMMSLGIGWARRGWVLKDEVINTYSLKKLSNILGL
ncbi:MAG: DNA polymerase/3'-5' exonuclease PolX [Patescibacteria group bacterium]